MYQTSDQAHWILKPLADFRIKSPTQHLSPLGYGSNNTLTTAIYLLYSRVEGLVFDKTGYDNRGQGQLS